MQNTSNSDKRLN